MTLLRIQVSLKPVSNLVKDYAQNTFWFGGSDSAGTMATTALTGIQGFYNNVHSPGTIAIAGYLSGAITRTNGALYKIYDWADPKPRAPINSGSFTLSALSGTAQNFPSETALCLSYKGAGASGVPVARQRGRLYIGPLNTNTTSGSSGAISVPTASFQNALAGAGAYLAGLNTIGTSWVVRSETGGFSTVITNGWVDNAWDTQRRRGEATTSRVTW